MAIEKTIEAPIMLMLRNAAEKLTRFTMLEFDQLPLDGQAEAWRLITL